MKDFKRLLPYLKGSWGLAVASLVFAFLSVAAKMAIPFLAGLAIDRLYLDYSADISLYLILIAFMVVFGGIFRYLYEVTAAWLGQRLVLKMREEVFKSYNRVSIAHLDSSAQGDLLLRLVNDIENVQTGLIAGVMALFEGIVQIVLTLVFMFILNWILALVVILLTPISILVSRFVSNHNSAYFQSQNAITASLTAFSLESINNLEASRSYGLFKDREKEFDGINSRLRGSNFKATFAVGWINPSTRLVNNLIYAIVAFLGAYLLLTSPANLGLEAFAVGSLSSLLSYAYQYMAPFNEISSVASEISFAVASFRRVDEAINLPGDSDEGQEHLEQKITDLAADHLNFSYDGIRPIIKDFDVDIYPGHKIALVGPTGCGKTTIINLLLRFYDPQSGSFQVNGRSSLLYPKKELRSHIGMVLQDTWLFHGSIKNNIGFGKKDAKEEEIVAAAKKAHADGFIRQLPDGYDTIVSNSSGLSTGQKQLLCVARMMLAEPEIVILDEATSNIDLRTELLLSHSFDELMRGKTSLVVAHRLSTIKNADLIIVMKAGEIVEKGNFQELMSSGGFFKELYDSQLS